MAKSIQKQYNEWITKVYGGVGLTKIQREEMRKAFFCGAFVMMNTNRELGALEDTANAVKQLTVITHELLDQIQIWTEVGEGNVH